MLAFLRGFVLVLALVLTASGQALGTRTLEEARARDARVSFSAESARRARALLERPPASALERSIAAVALGTSRSSADVARLEALASEGPEPERRAALYGLGELGAVGLPALERLNRRDPAALADAQVVALFIAAQGGAAEARTRLASLAGDDGSSASFARAGLGVLAGEAPGPLGAALQLHYELRWRAAQVHGFVDGDRWQKVRLRELAREPDFHARVIFGASEPLFAPALKAHLIETLARGEPAGALELAAHVLTRELGAALKAGEWQPAGVESWARILGELERTRSERNARELVEHAYLKVPELETVAGILLLRAGGDLPWKWVADRLVSGTPAERAALVFAVGERGQRELVADLADLLQSRPDLELSGPGLIALVRLGHEPALEAASDLVEAETSPAREALVRALLPALHDKRAKKLALEAAERSDLPRELAVDLAIALAASGEREARQRLRAELPEAPPGVRRLAAVRALATSPEPADIDVLARLFPLEGDLETNVALAMALLRARHPASRPVLQAALWDGDWTVSLLAGGLIVSAGGAAGLSDELDAAPAEATEGDLRRVGFALGEWGGQSALDELLRRRPETDPAVQGALLGLFSARALSPAKPAGSPASKSAPRGKKAPKPAASPLPGSAGGAAKPAGKGRKLPKRGR